ncbi:MAG: hypothetical protein WCF70_10810 [Dehalococcoidales bacterium]
MKKLIGFIIPPLAALMLLAGLPVPVLADSGLQVSNPILVTDVSPGQTLTFKMTVSIGTSDPTTNIAVQVDGLAQSLDGTNGPAAAANDASPYSARSFITVDSSSFQLQPGGSQDVTATIKIPQDVGAGGRYAMIQIATLPPAGGSVSIASAVNVPIVLTVTGSQLVQTGKITALTTSQPVSGQPLDIFTTLQNTGNHHFKFKNEVTVSDSKGKVLGTIDTPLTSSSIVPAMSMQIEASFIPQSKLPSGIYSVASKVMLDDGTVLDTASSSFTVGASGLAPVSTTTPAKITSSVSTTGTSPILTATTAGMNTTSPAATATATGVSWPVFGGVVAGVVIIAAGIIFFIMRRKGKH